MWGSKKVDAKELHFVTRGEAFAYMLRWQIEEKNADPMEAAQKANQFADIFAENMGIPKKVEPPAQGVDKYIQMADKVVCYCDQHPKIVEYVTGAVTFFAGLVTGKKLEQSSESTTSPQVQPVNFDELN